MRKRHHTRLLFNGKMLRLPLKHKILRIHSSLHRVRIGLRTLQHLGYEIAFFRPEGFLDSKRNYITYHIQHCGPLAHELSQELDSGNMKRGLLSQLTRKCFLILTLHHLNDSYNLPTYRQVFEPIAVHYFNGKSELLDCITFKQPISPLDRAASILETLPNNSFLLEMNRK